MKIVHESDYLISLKDPFSPTAIVCIVSAIIFFAIGLTIIYITPVVITLDCNKDKNLCTVTRNFIYAPQKVETFNPESFVKSYRHIYTDRKGQRGCKIRLQLKDKEISFLNCKYTNRIDPIIYKMNDYFKNPKQIKFNHEENKRLSGTIGATIFFIGCILLFIGFIKNFRLAGMTFDIPEDSYYLYERKLLSKQQYLGKISNIRNIKVEKADDLKTMFNNEGLYISVNLKDGEKINLNLNFSIDKKVYKEIKKLKKVILQHPEK